MKLDEIKVKLGFQVTTSWVQILKTSMWNGGPSSTRFAFLFGSTIVALCLLMLTVTFCLVYACGSNHPANVTFGATLGGAITSVVGFLTYAQNTKNKTTTTDGGTNANTPDGSSEPSEK